MPLLNQINKGNFFKNISDFYYFPKLVKIYPVFDGSPFSIMTRKALWARNVCRFLRKSKMAELDAQGALAPPVFVQT